MTSDGKTSLNLELLIKLLKLTTSSNDGEALLASRKANEVLGKFGGDWEALLRGKVTVIADPFAAAATPVASRPMHNAPVAPRPQQPPRAAAQSPSRPQAAAQSPSGYQQQKTPPSDWATIDAAARAQAAAVANARAAAAVQRGQQRAKTMQRATKIRRGSVNLDDLA